MSLVKFWVAALSLVICLGPEVAFGMARPKCNFTKTPTSKRVQPVRIVNSSLGELQGISPEEGEAAILSALQRWNQQSESGISFVYEGYASGTSCDYATIIFNEECDIGRAVDAYFHASCKSGSVYNSWSIYVCNSYVISDEDESYRRWFHLNPNSPGTDLVGVIMHELGHAQGLGHPGEHVNAPPGETEPERAAREYCGGDASVMGYLKCQSELTSGEFHHGWARDLFRYDLTCSEERNGVRQGAIHRITEQNGTFTHTTHSASPKISNVAAWSSSVRRFVASLNDNYSWRNWSSLNTVISSVYVAEGLRSRRAASTGKAGTTPSFITTWHEGEADDWFQSAYGYEYRFNSSYAFTSSDPLFQCSGPSCEYIRSYHPVELFGVPNDSDTYGIWATHSRQSRYAIGGPGPPYNFQLVLARRSAVDGKFSENLLNVTLYSAVKPAVACISTGWSFLSPCMIYFVPVSDSLHRIHAQIVYYDSAVDRFIPFLDMAPSLVLDEHGLAVSTGSDLAVWQRVRGGSQYHYLAFTANEPNFPVRVIEMLDLGSPQRSIRAGRAFSRPTVQRRDFSATTLPADLVWVGP